MRVKNILNETLGNISTLLNVDKERARIIKKLIKGDIAPETFSNVKTWVNQCFNYPKLLEMIQEALNQVLGAYGTEPVENYDNWINSFYHYINYIYCNNGDIYQNTIIFDTEKEVFFINSVGNILEALNL